MRDIGLDILNRFAADPKKQGMFSIAHTARNTHRAQQKVGGFLSMELGLGSGGWCVERTILDAILEAILSEL